MKNNKKKTLTISIAILIIILLIILGVTFAYFLTRIDGNEKNQSINVTTANLEVTYVDGEYSSNGLEEPGFISSKKFSVKNTGTGKAYYSISMENVINTFARKGDWTFDLIRNKETIITGIPVPYSDTNITYVEEIEAGTTNEYVLNTIYSNLRVDQSEDMNARVAFKINIIEAVQEPDLFKNAESGTILEAIGKYNLIQEPLTKPGENTLPEETVLAETQDDYGTGYYFRGRVANNYVTFNNMCWMILRVLGNGDIKLVLADENRACGIENGYDWKDGTTGLINRGQGYTYGSNIIYETSNIKTELDAWLGEKGIYHHEYLGTTEWCNDTSTYNLTSSPDEPVYQYNTSRRLEGLYATLKCDMEGATKYTFDSGILTADEIAYAGGSLESPSEPSWININGDTTWWWTMSPSGLSGSNTVWNFMGNWLQLNNNGNIKTYTGSNGGAIRPVIVLKGKTAISSLSGNGSINRPYIID